MSLVYEYNKTYNCHIIDQNFYGMARLQYLSGSSTVYSVLPSSDVQEDIKGVLLPIWSAFFVSFKRLMQDDSLSEEDYEAAIWLWSKYFSPELTRLVNDNGKVYGLCGWITATPTCDMSAIIQRVWVIIRAHRLEFDD